MASPPSCLLLLLAILLVFASPAAAFGAGNIASIAKIEGKNFRHGDIEDLLKTVACVKGHKWTSMMIRRVYFGNWLRDYSQALDVGTLKSCQADTIRILVWVLSFLGFGYATAEFEVTRDRLGVYRPEEHIDNPKDYADNVDARKFDPRLRPPVQPIELEVDHETGLKNYIANERLGIATSIGYVKFSLARSIHYGRMYTSGSQGKGKEEDLCEALRCLGQALHCLEDYGAHTNYVELVLREMGFRDVFPHTGTATEINLRGHRVFPLVTGTFGVVDFLHSVIGEATDNLTQSEVQQMDTALGNALAQSTKDGASTSRSGPDGSSSSGGSLNSMTSLLSQVPGARGLVQQAQNLQSHSDEQARANTSASSAQPTFEAPPGSAGGPPGTNIPGTSIDPQKTLAQIYPILEFRDKVARAISATIEKVPGLQTLVEKITETVTLFVLSLLAPFIRPIINAVSASLKQGSSGVIGASARHQYEPWTDPYCTDPTHSLLSKDHFSNILNEPAGKVASSILQYVAPRVIYGWENPGVPVDQILNDIVRVFHHPAIRDSNCEIHQIMFSTVEQWVRSRSDGGGNLDQLLSSQSVREGKNHTKQSEEGSNFGSIPGMHSIMGNQDNHPQGGQGVGGHGYSSYLPQGMPHLPQGANSLHIPHMPQGFMGAGHGPGHFGGVRDAPEDDYPGKHAESQPQYPQVGEANDPYSSGPPQYQQGYEGQQPPQHGYQGQPPQLGYNPGSCPAPQYGFGNQPPPQQPGFGGRPPGQYYAAGQY